MGYAQPVTIEMTDMHCGNCGITYAVPEAWRAEKQKNGAGFYCPNGCNRVYRESDADKVRKELQAEKEMHKRTLARLNEAEAAEQKAVSELKRQRKRHAAGICPCCNRTLQQLMKHMKTKHPDYSLEGAGERQ